MNKSKPPLPEHHAALGCFVIVTIFMPLAVAAVAIGVAFLK